MPQLHASSRVHRHWNFILFITVLYNVITLPTRLAFGIEWTGYWLLADGVADLILALDIYLMYHTPFLEKGRMVQSARAIRANYHRTRAPVDMLASFPLDWILLLGGIVASPYLHAAARLPRLLRLAYFSRHFHLWERHSQRSSNLFRLIKLGLWILMATHFVGSAWFAVGAWEAKTGASWLIENGLIEKSEAVQYLWSWYWAITTITTVGYGDITPTTEVEVVFTIAAMITGVSLWAYVIGNVASLVSNLDTTRTAFNNKMDGVKQYMRYRELPLELQQRVTEHYDFLWSEGKALEEKSLFSDLPTGLRGEMSLFLNREIVAKVPFFQGRDEGFIRSIVSLLRPQVFCPGDRIITAGEIGHEMYFLSRGKVDVLSADERSVVHSYHSGDFFGELAILFAEKRSATVIASTHCDVFVLTKEELAKIFTYYPDFKERLQEIADERYEAVRALK